MEIDYASFLKEMKECGKEIIDGTMFKHLEARTSGAIFRTIAKALLVAFSVGIIASVIVNSSILSCASCLLVVSHFARQKDVETIGDFFAEHTRFYEAFKKAFLV